MQFTPVLNLFTLRIPLKNNYYKTIVVYIKKVTGLSLFHLINCLIFQTISSQIKSLTAEGSSTAMPLIRQAEL